MMKLPVGKEIIMGRKEFSTSQAPATRSMAALITAAFILLNTSLLMEAKAIKDVGSNSSRYAADDRYNLSLKAEYVITASEILRSVDSSVDPCEDFHRYACGGFLKSTVIPEGEVQVDRFTTLRNKVQRELEMEFKAEIKPDDPKHVELVKKLYKSCMNTSTMEANGKKTLLDLIEKLGEWSLLEHYIPEMENFDLASSIEKSHKAGFVLNSFIEVDVGPDPRNNTNRVIYLRPAIGPFSRILKREENHEINSVLYAKYLDTTLNMMLALGAEDKRVQSELNEVANLDSFVNPSRTDESPEITTLGELTKKFPTIAWNKILRAVLPSSINFNDNETLIVTTPEYMDKLIFDLDEFFKRVQANYVIVNAIYYSLKYLYSDIYNAELDHNQMVKKSMTSRSWQCSGQVLTDLPVAVAAIYARKYLNRDSKTMAEEMIMDIKKQFDRMIRKVDWMDEKTRRNTLDKIATMPSYVAYFDEILDDKKLEKHFENLQLSEDNFFGNFLNLSRFSKELSLSKLREPISKTDWRQVLPIVPENLYHRDPFNRIVLAAGILQIPLFGNDLPKYMNYGAIGSIVGHEIARGLDLIGALNDENTNSEAIRKKINERLSCLQHQYDKYVVDEVQLNVDGKGTLEENFADHLGIKAAYRAYNRWVANNGPEQDFLLLNVTAQQMFWVSYANMLCSTMRPEAMRKYIDEKLHSPNEFRILGPLSNIPDFARDFACPAGSKMIPEKRSSFVNWYNRASPGK